MTKQHTLTSSAPPKRILHLDVLRIIAIILVVLLHTGADFVLRFAPGTKGFFYGHLFNSLGRAGVGIFVMISGALLLDDNREFTLKTALKKAAFLLGLYLFWSVIAAIFTTFIMPALRASPAPITLQTLKTLLKHIVFPAVELWYLLMLGGLYLITPILRCFINKENKHITLYFLLLAFVFQFVLPSLLYLVDVFTGVDLSVLQNDMHLQFIGGYTFYYVFGYAVHHLISISAKTLRRIGFYSMCLGFMVLFGGVYLLSIKQQAPALMFYDNLLLPVCLYSAGIFLFVRSLCLNKSFSARTNKIVTRASLLCFGVYVLHQRFLSVFQMLLTPQKALLLCLTARFVLTLLCSFGAAWILSKVPGIRRMLRA